MNSARQWRGCKLNELALFAGAGGGLLGSKLLGWQTVCYVEWDKYAIEVLKARIRDGYLDDAPIWDDAKNFDGHPWAGCVDIITAGFPCQPWSGAGKRLGELDKRNLWPDTLRIVREVRPEWILLENVARLLSNAYIRRIFADLAEVGYDARWDCISAAAIGAPHRRDRLWIVAHANSQRPTPAIQYIRSSQCQATSESGSNGKIQSLANPDSGRQQEYSQFDRQTEQDSINRDTQGGYIDGFSDEISNSMCNKLEKSGDQSPQQRFAEIHWWDIEPELGRVADGVAHRVDRLRAIGNGQVPAVVREAWEWLR